jgi:hypothetical protein
MSKCTIVTGFALMTAMCILNGISFIMLAYCCELSGTFNYKVGTAPVNTLTGTCNREVPSHSNARSPNTR